MMIQTERNGVSRTCAEAGNKLDFLIQQGKRLGLLLINGCEFESYSKENELFEIAKERLELNGGQFILLNPQRFDGRSFAEICLEELEAVHFRDPLRIELPYRNEDETAASPFIRRAILWQRLCDRLIEDEEFGRPTLFIVENFDLADERTQADFERLLRFHQTHQIRRTFLLTVQKENVQSLPSSLQSLVDLRFEV